MSLKIRHKKMAELAKESIEQAILSNQFIDYLPPERRLCETLGISRPVLRCALTELEKSGVVKLLGKRRKIIKSHPKKTNLPTQVCLLCRQPWETLENEILQLQEFLAEEFSLLQISFHLQVSASSYNPNPDRHLDRLTSSSPHTLWLLFRSTPAMQKWFQQQNVPAVVLGSNHPGIDLPNIDTDYFTICHHAAGLLIGRGHHNVAILKHARPLPGDETSIDGFTRGWEMSSKKSGEKKRIIYAEHTNTPESVCRAVDRLLTLEDPPTAWFIFGSRIYFTVLAQLAQKRLVVGEDIHLLSRDFDPYFPTLIPSVATYQRKTDRLKKQLFSMLEKILNNQPVSNKHIAIEAEFENGKSLGRITAN